MPKNRTEKLHLKTTLTNLELWNVSGCGCSCTIASSRVTPFTQYSSRPPSESLIHLHHFTFNVLPIHPPTLLFLIPLHLKPAPGVPSFKPWCNSGSLAGNEESSGKQMWCGCYPAFVMCPLRSHIWPNSWGGGGEGLECRAFWTTILLSMEDGS